MTRDLPRVSSLRRATRVRGDPGEITEVVSSPGSLPGETIDVGQHGMRGQQRPAREGGSCSDMVGGVAQASPGSRARGCQSVMAAKKPSKRAKHELLRIQVEKAGPRKRSLGPPQRIVLDPDQGSTPRHRPRRRSAVPRSNRFPGAEPARKPRRPEVPFEGSQSRCPLHAIGRQSGPAARWHQRSLIGHEGFSSRTVVRRVCVL